MEEEIPEEEGELSPEEMPESMPGEEGEEMPADPNAEGEIVGDDTDSSVGLGSGGGGDISSIMANLEDILASLGGGKAEEEEEPLPDDQYGA